MLVSIIMMMISISISIHCDGDIDGSGGMPQDDILPYLKVGADSSNISFSEHDPAQSEP